MERIFFRVRKLGQLLVIKRLRIEEGGYLLVGGVPVCGAVVAGVIIQKLTSRSHSLLYYGAEWSQVVYQLLHHNSCHVVMS